MYIDRISKSICKLKQQMLSLSVNGIQYFVYVFNRDFNYFMNNTLQHNMMGYIECCLVEMLITAISEKASLKSTSSLLKCISI